MKYDELEYSNPVFEADDFFITRKVNKEKSTITIIKYDKNNCEKLGEKTISYIGFFCVNKKGIFIEVNTDYKYLFMRYDTMQIENHIQISNNEYFSLVYCTTDYELFYCNEAYFVYSQDRRLKTINYGISDGLIKLDSGFIIYNNRMIDDLSQYEYYEFVTGDKKWSFEHEGQYQSHVVKENIIIMQFRKGEVARIEKTMIAIDINSGMQLWTKKGWLRFSLLGSHKELLCIIGGCDLVYFDPKTGERIREIGGGLFRDMMIVEIIENKIFYIKERKYLGCFDAETNLFDWEYGFLAEGIYVASLSHVIILQNGQMVLVGKVPDRLIKFDPYHPDNIPHRRIHNGQLMVEE